MAALFLCSSLLATCAMAQEAAPFSASPLVRVGDEVKYGVYLIRKVGEGIYQLNNRPVHPPIGTPGALGVDFYLICGNTKALMIDSGNNYMDGNRQVPQRINGAEELRSLVAGLMGKVPLEMAVTHMHADHNGMSGAFVNQNVKFWAGEGEDVSMLKTQLNLDTSLYQLFRHGEKTFDLGGGRIVETFLLRGHTNGGTVYIMRKEGLLFTGDCFGNGEGLGMGRPETIKDFAVDGQRIVDYILANFSPYERYALKVYSGHSWENGYQGMYKESMVPVDVGYLDWRFIQNMASCANGIIKGLWLVEGSGLRFVEYSTDPRSGNYNPSARPGEKRGAMIYGIGSMMGSLQAAYDAAGLKMPQ
jgi:glyoxylase-like metal-dependent hydrolase (beta-lactamase superfamily II)